jgi:hypothetical protein
LYRFTTREGEKTSLKKASEKEGKKTFFENFLVDFDIEMCQ